MVTTPTAPPPRFTAGDTWKWKRGDHADYAQADGWTFEVELVGREKYNVTAVWQSSGADENNWLVSVTPADSADWLPGTYTLHGYFQDGTDKYTVLRDQEYWILPDPRTADSDDFLSHEEKMIPLLEARIQDHMTDEFLIHAYGSQGRSVTMLDLPAMERMLAVYRSKVWRRRHPGRLGITTRARFTR